MTTLATLRNMALGAASLLCTVHSSEGIAGSIVGSWGDPTKNNGLTVEMTDTIDHVDLTLRGGALRTGETVNRFFQTPTPAIPGGPQTGGFWRASVTLSIDPSGDDELNLGVDMRHISQPHPIRDMGDGGLFQGGFRVLAQDFPPFGGAGFREVTLTGFNPPAGFPMRTRRLDHGLDSDFYSGDELVFRVSESGLFNINQNIDQWRYTLTGDHFFIPEPGTIFLFGSAIAGLLALARSRKYQAAALR